MPRRSGGSARPVRYVIASMAVSGFGTWGYNVGIAVYAFEVTHSATWVAIATVGRYLPAIVLSWLLAGLVDRLPRRGLVLGADLLCAVVMVGLSLLGQAHAPVWAVTLVAAVSSTSARIQAAGVLSLAADVVAESQLARASVLAVASEAVATAAGSATASLVLLAFDPATLFLLNAATFVVSAGCLMRIRSVPAARRARIPRAAPAPPTAAPWSRIWPLVACRTTGAVVYGMDVVLLTVVAARQLGSGASGYGWLLAAAGLGGVLVLGPAHQLVGGGRRAAAVSTTAMIAYAAPLLVFAFHPGLGGLGVQVLRGAGAVVATSSVMSPLQRSVPSASAGRVFGTVQSLVLVGTCIGSVATPVLLHVVGFDATVVIGALAPCVLQLALHPLLVRFHRRDAQLLHQLDPRLAVLRRLDLLRDASRATLYQIADSLEEWSVDSGTVIVSEGERADALHVVVSGDIVVTGGPDHTVYRRQTGPAYVGEIGLIHGIPRTATVTTESPCRIWRVPGQAFLAAVSEAGVSGALQDTMRMRIATWSGAPSARPVYAPPGMS